jgi:hypothetical protein
MLLFFFFLKVPIEWEAVSVTPVIKNGKTAIPDEALKSVKKNTIALKGKININTYFEKNDPK